MAKLDAFIKENLKCLSCGCIMVPDATKCPNCHTDYADKRYSEKINNTYPDGIFD